MTDLPLDRRQFLAAGGACLASCGAGVGLPDDAPPSRLDALLAAHADVLPEREGAGANHYPMAAEVLAARGFEDEIDRSWIDGASGYAGVLGRTAPLRSAAEQTTALGDDERYGDWVDLFGAALASEPWRAVVARWCPRLAPGLAAAGYHGLIRTGHAVRALRARETPERRRELAVGLAYWAARYVELPTRPGDAAPDAALVDQLAALDSPWRGDRSDVPFDDLMQRLVGSPLAPPVSRAPATRSPAEALDAVVHGAATGFLEMLVLERHRIWLLHSVTGPAAAAWLLPELTDADARALVAHAQRSVVALYAAYGEPFTPRAHVRRSAPGWDASLRRAADSGSVHGLKLVDALARFDRGDDPLWRSVAAQWFEWT